MQITFTRIVILFSGITFGFFIGCSTVSTSSKEPVKEESLTRQELEAELKKLNDQLDAGTNNADIYYDKGYLLSQYAQKTVKPDERTPIYRDMHSALKKAETQYNNANIPSGKQKVDELLKISWSAEHNLGVQIMQSDSTLDGKDYEKAASHFNNATVLLPDTAISYKMEARAHYQNHKPEQSIATLEKAARQIENLPAEMMEQLAFLYLETNQPQKAVSVYEKAESFSSDNLNIIHGLANAYISAQKHKKAIDLLEGLVDEMPANVIYAEALGTEYFYLAGRELNSVKEADAKDDKAELLTQADSLFGKAEAQFRRASSENSENAELLQAFARFYQNTAAKYQSILSEVNEEQQEQVKAKITDYLGSSIPLFEKLVQQNSDSSEYWSNLYRAYSYLGMEEKAEEAKSKFN